MYFTILICIYNFHRCCLLFNAFKSLCFLDAMDSFMEETGVQSFVGSLQDGSIPQVMPQIMERILLIIINNCFSQSI